MTCDELQPDYVLFALGTLEDPERSELREHLNRGCDTCHAGLKEARAWVYAFGAAVDGPEPPGRLRSRVLASTGAVEVSKWSWRSAWQACGVTVLILLGVFLYFARQREAEFASLQQEIGRRETEAAGLRAAISLLQSPGTREVVFGEGTPAPPRGRIFVNPSNGILLIASNLPAPPAGKAYEMWIVPKSGSPVPAGLFSSGRDGSAIHLYHTTIQLAQTGAVAVTLESAGGAPAPTSQPVIAAAL